MSGGTPPDISGKADTVLTTNGDTLYYNNGRQRLAKGTDSQVLTLSSGLPSWATADSGKMVLLDTYVCTTAEKTHSFTGSWNLDTDYSKLIVNVEMYPTNATIFGLQVNNQGSGNWWGMFVRNNTTLTGSTGGGANIWHIMNLAENNSYCWGSIEIFNLKVSTDAKGYHSRMSRLAGADVFSNGYMEWNSPIVTEIELFNNTGTVTWRVGTKFTLYGVKN